MARGRWTGTWSEWRRVGDVRAPGRLTAQWADEPAPWIEIESVRIRVDAPIEAALERARAVLEGAPGQSPRTRT